MPTSTSWAVWCNYICICYFRNLLRQNLGTDVIYSGTVAAAIEGLVEGKPSIALSCDSSKVSSGEYREAAKYTAKLIQKLEGNLDKLNGNIHIFDLLYFVYHP